MHIVILGAGALGTVLAAHLARSGVEATLIGRGQRAAYLREHGATVTGLTDFTVPVRVTTEPEAMKTADVLIVTVKTYDTAAALASVKHLQVDSVLSVQNGVLKNEQLAATFGWPRVLGTMAICSAEVLASGAVRFTLNDGWYLGELPEGTSARVEALTEALNEAGIVAHSTPHIQAIEWSKYVAFLCLMVPAVLTRLETYKVLQDPDIASTMAALLHETAHIAAAQGIELIDMPPLPVKTLSQLSLPDTTVQLQQVGAQFASRAPRHKISTLQDAEQGKRLEVEETLGYAVRKGIELQVPTPTMAVCYALLAGLNRSVMKRS